MTIDELNDLNESELKQQLEKCCGSSKWVSEMSNSKPFTDKDDLFEKASTAWENCNETDYKEAFSHHPKIGDASAIREKFAATADWAEGEQADAKIRSQEVAEALAECNRLYEEKFGYIFIVNATGKSAEVILGIIRWRLLNTPEDEIHIAAEEQAGITKLRLEKLIA